MNELLDYYKECFELVDIVHYNSEMTRLQYEKSLGSRPGVVVPITHGGIKDNREVKEFSKKGLVVGFIGSNTPYKGLQVLSKAVEGLDIEVNVWGGKKSQSGRMHFMGKFCKEDMPLVYKGMDVLVVPSIWKETFSLVTLEALSFGVPVLVSDNVGAKDIVKVYMPEFIYEKESGLRDLLSLLVNDKNKLIEYNKIICEMPWRYDVSYHAEELIKKTYI